MTAAHIHRRAANLIKKRYQSKFPDTSNLALERRKPPKEWLTRQPPSFSDIFGTAATDVVFPGIGTNTQTATSPTTTSTTSTSSTPTSSSVTSTSTTTVTTTTSSSTSTTPTTTSSSSKPVKTAPYTPPVTTSVTRTTAEAAVTSSAAAVAQTGASSSGAIAGGIIAAILAIAGIIFAILFIRRQRKRQAEENAFDAKEFRRSAMLMSDPPTHEDTIARGFNPRPPSMIERHMTSPASTFGAQYPTQAPVAGAYAYTGEEYPSYNPNTQYASFAPGQVVNYNAPPPKPLPNPFATPTKAQFGPIAMPGQYEQQVYNDQGSLTRQLSSGSTATYPVLTRQSSLTNPHPHQENAPPVPVSESTIPDNDDYVDLSRSSVSPYQAAQYAEISRRLQTDVPNGLTTPEAAQSQFALAAAAVNRDLPPLPPPKEDNEHQSPFADPNSTPSTPTIRLSNTSYNQQLQNNQQQLEQQQGETRPISAAESDLSQEVDFPVDLEFPVPPSPVHTISSRYRIDSTPPMLPEILVESRVSVSGYEFAPPPHHGDTNSNLGLSPLGSGFPSPGFMPRFPATPSPLASSFGVATPTQEKGFDQERVAPPPLVKQEKQKINGSGLKRSNTVYSMYDAEDAYGGI